MTVIENVQEDIEKKFAHSIHLLFINNIIIIITNLRPTFITRSTAGSGDGAAPGTL